MQDNTALSPIIKSIISDVIRITEEKNKKNPSNNSDAAYSFTQILCNISPDQLAFLRTKEAFEEFSYNNDTTDFLEQFTKFPPSAPKGNRVAVSVSLAQYNSLAEMFDKADLCAITKSILFDITFLAKKKIEEDVDRQEKNSRHIYYTLPCYISPEQIVYLRSDKAKNEFSYNENTSKFLEQFTDFTPRVI